MRVFRIDPRDPDPLAIGVAAATIRAGGTVAFPTETVYGLGASALDASAVAKIYTAKGRPSHNPLIVHCADRSQARELAADWPEAAEILARRYWPGPLTVVVRKRAMIPDEVTAGLPTVALRVPDHPVAQALLAAAGVPIAAPSANRFTELSPTNARHVEKGLSMRIDVLLDGGPTPVGIESTVVDLSGPEPVLLRPGSVDPSELERLLGRELLPPAVYSADAPRPAPGMTARHYSPRAAVVLLPHGGKAAREEALATALAARQRVAILAFGEPAGEGAQPSHPVVRMPSDPAIYARDLYATLHDLDEAGVDLVLIEAPPATRAWEGVRDRLTRAAVPSS